MIAVFQIVMWYFKPPFFSFLFRIQGNIEGAIAMAREAVWNSTQRSDPWMNLFKVYVAGNLPRLALAALNNVPAPSEQCFKQRVTMQTFLTAASFVPPSITFETTPLTR